MLGRIVKCIVIIVITLFFSSCTKMPEWGASEEGDIVIEKLSEKGSIPSKFGNLVSVNQNLSNHDTFTLWFQDENGSLRLVFYDIRRNTLATNVYFIPRK